MSVEKIANRARIILLGIGVVGGVMLVLGGLGLRSYLIPLQNAPQVDWNHSLVIIVPLTGLMLTGAVITLLAMMLYAVSAIPLGIALELQARTEQLAGAMENHRQVLEAIREAASLSDAAKSITYRQKDREALRQAIGEDIEKGDFEAANQLVEEMERRYGYKDVDQLREQIENGWRAARERMIQESITQVESHLARYEWVEAQRICNRLLKRFAEHEELQRLTGRIQLAKDNHKRELLKLWKDALAKDDVDTSVELLKQLDQYLSSSEAEAYKESARDVFRKRLQQMGVQFALHVHDKNWNEAVRIGKQITDEFPNTRIAAEVREKMAILIEKANQPLGV